MEASRIGKGGSLAASIARKVERVFSRLGSYPYFNPGDLEEFGYYRHHFLEALEQIDMRIAAKQLAPVELSGFPRETHFKDFRLNAALFIGSFDPFQMTHLATALRYLANPRSTGNVVFVIPEGGRSSLKPNRSDYAYRLDILNRQLSGVFEPLVVPLDIGKDVDTLDIVRNFLSLFPGAKIEITHLVGSDVIPYAARLMPEDLKAWGEAARSLDVDFNYRIYMVRRREAQGAIQAIKTIRALGVRVDVDRRIVEAPSSTDFRERGAFTIVFPTEQALSHLEILFRYNLNKPWMAAGKDRTESSP
jgi:nicotinic acid mononucleotide adenylyltransferase